MIQSHPFEMMSTCSCSSRCSVGSAAAPIGQGAPGENKFNKRSALG